MRYIHKDNFNVLLYVYYKTTQQALKHIIILRSVYNVLGYGVCIIKSEIMINFVIRQSAKPYYEVKSLHHVNSEVYKSHDFEGFDRNVMSCSNLRTIYFFQ
jgi:hypothetical protein